MLPSRIVAISAVHATKRGAWRAVVQRQPLRVIQRTRGLATQQLHQSISVAPSANAVTRSKPLCKKVLIANRGEIACRIMRTCQTLGVKTVAVYSEADADCMHVKMADEAYCIGPAASVQSYLDIPKVIGAALASGADAIHPGYGFLSESAVFAEKVHDAGLTFIGPPTSAIKSMGSKRASKEIMLAAGVPCVPGYHGADQSLETLTKAAAQCGFPLLIKPTHGGGGKGMRISHSLSDFADELAAAQREAKKSFANDEVLLERYLTKPRHIEVQVFADKLGGCVSLWERDCSVQRRHQKIIEEAPAPGLSEATRAEMGAKAVAAAKAVDYVGAGTVEFIVDDHTGEYFFMEMNTRLQVEHPVTEMVTGLDLVQWQLEVASGNALPLMQSEIPLIGHSFEARIYAERPRANFLPDVGRLLHVAAPKETTAHRLETGFDQGDEISSFYDPMIAKLVVHGKDRADALGRLKQALGEYQVVGPSTNVEFLKALAAHPAFDAAEVDTGFIGRYHDDLFPPLVPAPPSVLAQAALYLAHKDMGQQSTSTDAWNKLSFRRFGQPFSRSYPLLSGGLSASEATLSNVTVSITADHAWTVAVSTPEQESTTYTSVTSNMTSPTELSARLGQSTVESSVIPREGKQRALHIFHAGLEHVIFLPLPAHELEDGSAVSKGNKLALVSPMPASIIDVRVKVGDTVMEGQVCCVLESMKMEISIRAEAAGVVKTVGVKKGDVVSEGAALVELAAPEGEKEAS